MVSVSRSKNDSCIFVILFIENMGFLLEDDGSTGSKRRGGGNERMLSESQSMFYFFFVSLVYFTLLSTASTHRQTNDGPST